MKKNVSMRGFKIIVVILLLLIFMMSFSTIAFAEDGIIEDKTIIINTMDGAKSIMADIQKTDIKCNLTIKCASQEIVDYVNNQLVGKPLALIYEPVKVLLDTSLTNSTSNTSNNSASNNTSNTNNPNNPTTDTSNTNTNTSNTNTTVGTSKDKDQSVTLQPNANNNEKNTSTGTDNKTNSASATTTADSNIDTSPKTGDSTQIYVLIACVVLSALTAVTTFVIKKRRSYL